MASTREGYLSVKLETTVAEAVKPTNFIRYKSGDIQYQPEIIENNPIQNNRWNAITPVEGESESSGQYEIDLDPNECVFWLKCAMGSMSSNDISSATDGSVYRHTIDHGSSLPALTIEQAKGNVGTTTDDGQDRHVNRAFGVIVDTFTLSANQDVVGLNVNCTAHGMFTQADLLANAGAGSDVDISLDQVDGLVAGDSIRVYDTTPQSEVDPIVSIDANAKTVEIATLDNSYTTANKGKIQLEPQTASYGTKHIPFAKHQVEVRFGDTVANALIADREKNMEQLEMTYSNNIEARPGLLRATPSTIAPRGNSLTMSFTQYFKNRSAFDAFKRRSKKSMVVTITNDEVVSGTDTNNATYKVRFEISELVYTEHDLPTGTDDLYAVQIQASAFYSDTDGRAFRVIVENSKADTVYA